jgi:hypothetical protein
MPTPSERKQSAYRCLTTLGYADFLMRSQFSLEDDEWTQSDCAIASNLAQLSEMMVDAANELISADRAQKKWFKKLRSEAAQQVNNTEAD